MKSSDTRLLRLIALFKLLKAILLIGLGVGALKLLHKNTAEVLENGILRLGLDPGSRHFDLALQKASGLTPNKIKGVSVGSFLYAGLFLTEGIGLWLRKRWGEWFTVIITSSLVPLEIYEIYHHRSAIKIVVLIVNLAIVAYLIYRIRNEKSA